MKDFVAYNSLNLLSKKARNVFRTYLVTYIQHMKPVETILSEKIEVDERWVLSDEWLSRINDYSHIPYQVPSSHDPSGWVDRPDFCGWCPLLCTHLPKKKKEVYFYTTI